MSPHTVTLVHSPAFSALLCSEYRQPSNYVGLAVTRPSTALETLLHKTPLGRAARTDTEGRTVGKEKALEEAEAKKYDEEKNLKALEQEFEQSGKNKKSHTYFNLMRCRANLARLTTLNGEISDLRKAQDIHGLGVGDEYDPHRQVPLLLSDAATRHALSASTLPSSGPGRHPLVTRCPELESRLVAKVNAVLEEAVRRRQEEVGVRTMPYTVTCER